MEDKTITTVHGYVVTLAPFLTYDQFVELQKSFTETATFNPSEGGDMKMGAIPVNMLYAINKMAVAFLVKKIVDKDGKEVIRTPESLPVPPEDGIEIADAIKKVKDEADTAFSKKKEIASSSPSSNVSDTKNP